MSVQQIRTGNCQLIEKGDEIMALESACLSSSEAFYPSTIEGDSEQNKKTILQSCRNPIQAFGKKDEGMTAQSQDFWSGRKWMAAMLQTAMAFP